MILYLPYPPNIATADFFLLRIVMAELADLLLSQDSLKTMQPHSNHHKRWTTAKSTSKSAVTRPKKVK
jgi:hypothetical protein